MLAGSPGGSYGSPGGVYGSCSPYGSPLHGASLTPSLLMTPVGSPHLGLSASPQLRTPVDSPHLGLSASPQLRTPVGSPHLGMSASSQLRTPVGSPHLGISASPQLRQRFHHLSTSPGYSASSSPGRFSSSQDNFGPSSFSKSPTRQAPIASASPASNSPNFSQAFSSPNFPISSNCLLPTSSPNFTTTSSYSALTKSATNHDSPLNAFGPLTSPSFSPSRPVASCLNSLSGGHSHQPSEMSFQSSSPGLLSPGVRFHSGGGAGLTPPPVSPRAGDIGLLLLPLVGPRAGDIGPQPPPRPFDAQ